ncbi:alanine racemase [Prosthecomicrobium hirschii]|uniref:alanine racemase n=1 Tax=Prosthecodimorpha hirschii TaxID=665126 RepID=UPI00221E6735|nr:alanine racemase [Prosthecomicrobium hirschii]MCW1841080.1 alanine racemase [Prosthecomicrobium hirschii]
MLMKVVEGVNGPALGVSGPASGKGGPALGAGGPALGAGELVVDLGALAANYAVLQARQPEARIAGVVKADAYGLGAGRVAKALYDAGCRDFFVAHLGEALDLAAELPATARIHVLNGLAPGAEAAAAAAAVIPVLNSLDQVARWEQEARRRNTRLPAAIQVDSGMARLGLAAEEVAVLAADPAWQEAIEVVLVMSHLACADEPAAPANLRQFECFRALAARLPAAPQALANSGGAFLPGFGLDLVRPGIALYGVDPVDDRGSPLKPVVSLGAPVIQLRDVPAGTGVGYGLAHVTRAPRRLATIGVGYADGWPRALSDRGAVYAGGIRLPIVGRVSMDSTIVDASALAPGLLRPGDRVELIGPHQSLADVARDAGTIAYEILTGLGARFERRYRSPTH